MRTGESWLTNGALGGRLLAIAQARAREQGIEAETAYAMGRATWKWKAFLREVNAARVIGAPRSDARTSGFRSGRPDEFARRIRPTPGSRSRGQIALIGKLRPVVFH